MSPSTSALLPFALKGIDLALFTIFRSLGLSVTARPMLDEDDEELSSIDERRFEQEFEESNESLNEHREKLADLGFDHPCRAGEGFGCRIGDGFSPTVIEKGGGYGMRWEESEKV